MINVKRSVVLVCVFCINLFFTDCLFAGKEQKFGGGQTITVEQDVNVTEEIAGNGAGDNGEAPFDQNPNNNVVRIAPGGVAGAEVYGSYCASGTIINNRVIIAPGGTVTESVYGGFLEEGNIQDIFVDIYGSVYGNVYCGYVREGTERGAINDSTVTVSGAVSRSVYGGLLERGDVISNILVRLEPGASVGKQERSLLAGAGGTGNPSKSGDFKAQTVERQHYPVELLHEGQDESVPVPTKEQKERGKLLSENKVCGACIIGMDRGRVERITLDIAGSVNGNIYGGNIGSGEIRNVAVNVEGDAFCVFGGKVRGNGYIEHSQVTINCQANIGEIYGGYIAGNGTIRDVSVNFAEKVGGIAQLAHVSRGVYGAYVGNGHIKNITLNIVGGIGQVEEELKRYIQLRNGSIIPDASLEEGAGKEGLDDVYGGYIVERGIITGVYVNFNGVAEGNIYGGWIGNTNNVLPAGRGSIINNTVVINKLSTVYGGVYGGRVESRESGITISNNNVQIHGRVFEEVYGGSLTEGKGSVSGNSVLINNSEESYEYSEVCGGESSEEGDSIANRVGLEHIIVESEVTGGRAGKGNANENTVKLNDVEVKSKVTGGRAGKGNANGNEVELHEGRVYLNIVGGFSNSSGEATSNKVTITTSMGMNVFGGVTNTGNACSNEITILNSKVMSVIGGLAKNGHVERNIVNIEYATSSGSVFGGYLCSCGVEDSTIYTISCESVTIVITIPTIPSADMPIIPSLDTIIDSDEIDEEIIITQCQKAAKEMIGSIRQANVFGQASQSVGSIRLYCLNSTVGSATYNTVNIGREVIFNENSVVYGGYDDSLNPENDVFTGNTLNLYSPIEVAGIKNFQNYNFYLPENIDRPMITAVQGTGESTLGREDAAIDLSRSIVGIKEVLRPLNEGEQFYLIYSHLGINMPSNPTTTCTTNGGTVRYTFNLNCDGYYLLATLENMEPTPQTQSYAANAAGGIIFINQGIELTAEKGISEAARGKKLGYKAFGVLGGENIEYESKTGTGIKVKGFMALAGIARGFEVKERGVTTGVFFEYGKGKNETSYEGKGEDQYKGVGLLGRINCREEGIEGGGFYCELSGRMGQMEMDYKMEEKIKYDYEAGYYGLHIGAGYKYEKKEKIEGECYVKYLYSSQEGKEVRLSNKGRIDFERINSQKIKAGVKAEGKAWEKINPYAGAAVEYELDGQVRSKILGMSIESPDLKGVTGIGEIGVRGKIGKRVCVDCSIQGHAGKREGITGMLKVNYGFGG